MSRRRNEALRPLSNDEREKLQHLVRCGSEPAEQVAHAKALLSVAEGSTYIEAARRAGRRSNDAVSQLVTRFNREGLGALVRRAGQGGKARYGPRERQRILAEVRRQPEPAADGTVAWSVMTLRRALREVPDGLSQVSGYTIHTVLREAGFRWLGNRSWCETGHAVRRRKSGSVPVTDVDAEAKKKLIAGAYRAGEANGLAVWTHDQAGPYQTMPYPGHRWCAQGSAQRYPSTYERKGTAKLLTLFHPASGMLRVQGVRHCTNAILHPWLEQEITAILATLPLPPPVTDPHKNRAQWQCWQQGLSAPITLPESLPPLRMLLVLDNLQGHKTPVFVLWLFAHGVMPLYTPLGGSWLNMAESIQRILKQRALAGQYPRSPEQIISLLEATAQGWNRNPTPFQWGGKRQARRQRNRQRRYAVGGSGACTCQPLRRHPALAEKWLYNCQMTH